MKRILALIICVCMAVSLVPCSAFAASDSLKFEEELARDLKELGLFKGVSDTDFALGRAPTRVEALVMLIRVLGKEAEALSKGGKHPFLDVPAWADKYVGYAYANKLTNGMSATKFGSNTTASSSMYITFVLRALGYSDANGADFTWDNPFTLAREVGIMRGEPDTIKFLRADVVLVSYAALEAEVKGTKETLAQKLIRAGVFSAAQYASAYNLEAFSEFGAGSAQELTSSEVYEKCSPAVFYIEVYDANGKHFANGSGFFIAADGTAVTNYHVIEGAKAARIKRADNGKVYNVVGVYDYNEKNDWAVIKIDGKDFPYLEIDKSGVKGGQEIFAIGSPIGLENTISEGLISNANRVLDGVSFIQISAPISPGSSGGALLNKLGKVIGITSAGFDNGQNLNLALPISVIDGYTKGNAYPLSAIGPVKNNNTLGNVDIDRYPEDKIGFEMLKMWIENYATDEIGGKPAYMLREKGNEGDTVAFLLVYDHEKDEITAMIMILNDTSSTGVSLTFGAYNMVDVFYHYDGPGYMGATEDSGLSRKDKKDFTENFKLRSFGTYDGEDAGYQDGLDYVNVLVPYIFEYMELIFESQLNEYGLDGVRSLGFTNMYFE